MPTVLDLDTANALSSLCRREVKIFIKVNVGLERLGISPDGLVDFGKAVMALPRLRLQGVYSHMHVPTGPGMTPYLSWQLDRFTAGLQQLRRTGIEVPIAMIASTGVLEASPSVKSLNAIDPGLVFFGLDQRGPGLEGIGLRPALRALKSRLIQVGPVSRTDFRDAAPFPIREGMRIGIIPIGQYDGMAAVCIGQVLVHGTRTKILGSPSVEYSRVDLTDVPAARVGDEVVVIGRQGDAEILPAEVARYHALHSGGMVALAIRDSVPRVYLREPDNPPSG
jgi:alanine racemase